MAWRDDYILLPIVLLLSYYMFTGKFVVILAVSLRNFSEISCEEADGVPIIVCVNRSEFAALQLMNSVATRRVALAVRQLSARASRTLTTMSSRQCSFLPRVCSASLIRF